VQTDDHDYLLVTDTPPPTNPNAQDKDIVWGKNGAHMAYITLQKAFSLKIHAGVWFEYEH
jgi:hypothetical protein